MNNTPFNNLLALKDEANKQIKHVETAIAIVAREELGIDTLETQNNDGLDFHDLSVASIKAALEEAYYAGHEAALKG